MGDRLLHGGRARGVPSQLPGVRADAGPLQQYIILDCWTLGQLKEQRKRFEARNLKPLKRWKLSDIDLAEHELYVKYSMAKDTTMARTDLDAAPWFVVPSDDKRAAQLRELHQPPAVVLRVRGPDPTPGGPADHAGAALPASTDAGPEVLDQVAGVLDEVQARARDRGRQPVGTMFDPDPGVLEEPDDLDRHLEVRVQRLDLVGVALLGLGDLPVERRRPGVSSHGPNELVQVVGTRRAVGGPRDVTRTSAGKAGRPATRRRPTRARATSRKKSEPHGASATTSTSASGSRYAAPWRRWARSATAPP